MAHSSDKSQQLVAREYKQIFEAASLGIARVAPDGSWLEINDRLCSMLHYSREELLGRTFQDITHPDDLDADLAYVQDMLDGKIDHYSMEKRYFRKDGSIIWINLSVTLIWNEDGSPNYFISIIDDIDNKVADRNTIIELKNRSEYETERYRNLIKNSFNGIIIYSPDGRVLEVNNTQASMLGYKPEDMLGMSYVDWDAHPTQGFIADFAEQVVHKRVQFETTHRRKDGSTYDALVVADTFVAGGHRFIYSSTRDITAQKNAQARIIKERNLAQHYLDIAGTMIIALDLHGYITLINREGCDILEDTEANIVGKNWFENFLVTDDLDMVRGWFDHLMSGEVEDYRYAENQIKTTRNQQKLITWHNSLVRDDSGEIIGLLSSGQDITEQRRLEDALKQETERFELAVAGTQDGLWDWDITTDKAYHSHRFETMLGYSGHELPDTAEAWAALIHPDDKDKAYTKVQEYLQNPDKAPYENTFRMRTKDGSWRWVTGRGKATFAEDGTPLRFVGFNTDVTREMNHQKELDHASKHDPLTGLANRFLLNELLQNALYRSDRQERMVAVLFIDLDGFKGINDRFGHDVGDLVLKEIAERMNQVVRKVDTLARLGGDEFAVIMSDLEDKQEILGIVNRLLSVIKQPIPDTLLNVGEEVHISASIGISFYPQETDVGSEALLRQADQAMYRSKQKGKDQYAFFDLASNQQMEQHRREIRRIEMAITNDELTLYYQPKIDMRTGTLIGFEALIRWNDPEMGLRGPDTFLPTARQDNEVMTRIGRWVFRQAFQQLADWKRQGYPWQVSVNICNNELHSHQFTEFLSGLLEAHPEVQARDIELEILESEALENIAYAKDIIKELQAQGFRIALDDFGTAYSTLAYLKELPVNTLKIDKSFVQDMLSTSGSLSIVEATIALAEAFRCKVVAEGVEEVEHGTTLIMLGCDFAQGYCISRPLPASKVTEWADSYAPTPAWTQAKRVDALRRSVLYSLLEHNIWVSNINEFLSNQASELPPLNPHQCRFGEWLDDADKTEWIPDDQQKHLREVHDQIHFLTQEILKSSEPQPELREQLNESHIELVNSLDRLLR